MPIAAITGGISAFGAYKASKAAKKAGQISTGQLADTRKQGDLLNETARMQQAAGQPFLAGGQQTFAGGQKTFDQGTRMQQGAALNPDFEQAAGYYRNILGGDRAAASGALAPDVAAITDNYRGAERSANANLRGGQRSLALSELNRDRVGKVSGLRAGLRPGAAAALSDIGRFRVGAGQGQSQLGLGQGALGLDQARVGANLLTGSAQTQGTVYGGQQNLFNTLNNNTQQANAYANQAGSAFGNTLIGLIGGMRGGGSPSPLVNQAPTPTYTPFHPGVTQVRP